MNYYYCLLLVIFVNGLPLSKGTLHLSVVHVNDFHARFEETDKWGEPCNSQECIGGFSRMYQTIMSLKERNPDSLILNAGDNFQGTIWYSIFKWNVTQYFLNKIPFDVYTLGNHEFDDTVQGAVTLMKHLKAPVVLSNVNDSREPTFQGLYTRSIVLERGGKKIGIIGVLLKEVKEKSKIGKLDFLDESQSINQEAERLVKEHNVFTNIILSHCGYDLEQEMAKKATGKISLIVGGHTHSLLWNGENPPSNAEKPEGPYPTVVKRVNGKKVLVVQASSFARYVGNLTISYDSSGDVTDWSGIPIFLDSSLPQNGEINREIQVWKERLGKQVNKVLGHTLTDLANTDCKRRECGLGNLVADAMVFSDLKYGTSRANLALVNCGSLKETIPRGNISYHQLLSAFPFDNRIIMGRIRGEFLLNALEHALGFFAEWRSRLLQVSGFQVIYDMRKPQGKRLVSARVRCSACKIPLYSDIVPDQEYGIATLDFLIQGGDGFTMFRDNFTVTRKGDHNIDVIAEYVEKKSPIWEEVEGRITILGDENIISKYR